MAQIRIPATVLKQKDKLLYLFKMNSELLGKITYVTPRSKENPDELQRVYIEARAKDIGAWLQEENSLLPNAIVVDFKDEVKIEPTSDMDVVTISFPDPDDAPDGKGKIAYILDGQHRVKGFEYSGSIKFDLAVIAVHNISENVRGKIFLDINSKQVKVKETLLLDLRAGIQDLAPDDDRVYRVIQGLNKHPQSPLRDKIQFLPEEKNKSVKNTNLFKHLKPHIANGGTLFKKTTAEQIEILAAYFASFKEVFADEWDDSKNYILSRNQGIELMCVVFKEIKHLCDLNEGGGYNKKSFKNQVSVLKGKSLEMRMKDKPPMVIPIDWSVDTFGKMSNRGWMAEIRKDLVNILTQ